AGLQNQAQVAHRKSGSADIDLATSGGDPETRTMDERDLADGASPLGSAAALAGGVDLPAIEQGDEVLTHPGHVRRHPDFTIPGSGRSLSKLAILVTMAGRRRRSIARRRSRHRCWRASGEVAVRWHRPGLPSCPWPAR